MVNVTVAKIIEITTETTVYTVKAGDVTLDELSLVYPGTQHPSVPSIWNSIALTWLVGGNRMVVPLSHVKALKTAP